VREFRILGPLEVIDDQQVLRLGGYRQRALLAILLLARREVVTSGRLIDRLWGERPPATAAKTLQVYISHLRAVLGNQTILTRANGYQLTATPDEVDAERFEVLAHDARRALEAGDAIGARGLVGSALAMWRGDALADFAAEAFARTEIRHLEEARDVALEDRIDCDLILARHRDLVGELEALVAAKPLRERLRGQLMTALYRCGRQADALQVYRDGRTALDDELGLAPGPELQALEQQILTQDPVLDVPHSTPAAGSQARARAADTRRPRSRSTLIAAGGAVLLAAAVAAVVTQLPNGDATALRARPNTVAAIDIATNRMSAQVPVGTRPGAISFGAGSLWVANLDDHTVSRIDPSTLRTLRTLPVGAPPTGIATSGTGVFVVTSPGSPAVLVQRIDPQFDTVKRTARLGSLGLGAPAGIAATDSSLWVAPSSGLLTRLDPETGRTLDTRDPNNSPAGIAVGSGAVWTTDNQADNITRVDSTGLIDSSAVGHGPSGVAAGRDAVWVADTGDDKVVRIDPSTGAVTATIPVGHLPSGIAMGGGSVWVTDSGDGTVDRIDPVANRVTQTIDVGGSPQQLVVAAGHVWVTINARTLPAVGAASPPGDLRLDSSVDVDSMDPALAYGPVSWQLLYQTCAKLLNYPERPGAQGSRLIPEVAQALPVRSPDGRVYTFTIRPGYRFSPPSNQVVTAQTFKATIERTLNPRMRSPVGGQLDDVVGVRAYRAGRAAHISGVSTHGNTLTLGCCTQNRTCFPDSPSRSSVPSRPTLRLIRLVSA
jgi:YVTN family beta-propeller protein